MRIRATWVGGDGRVLRRSTIRSTAGLQRELDRIVAANRLLMSAKPFPSLYSAGVRYRPEPRGRERWQLADALLASGIGDCEDLAAYRAAQVPGARAVARRSKGNPRRIWHCVVRMPDGSIEDPSARLGMGAYLA